MTWSSVRPSHHVKARLTGLVPSYLTLHGRIPPVNGLGTRSPDIFVRRSPGGQHARKLGLRTRRPARPEAFYPNCNVTVYAALRPTNQGVGPLAEHVCAHTTLQETLSSWKTTPLRLPPSPSFPLFAMKYSSENWRGKKGHSSNEVSTILAPSC